MSVDEVLLLGRVLFIGALYLFLIVLAMLLRRELRAPTATFEERAPGDLLIMEPFDAAFEAGERIALLGRSSIGREPENLIVLNDTFVSSDHARLTWNGRGWVLEDLGSTNGTSVNGKRVQRARAVKPGDTIEFGRVKTKLVQL